MRISRLYNWIFSFNFKMLKPEINGIEITCKDKELISLGLGLASGTINDIDLLNWIINYS